MMFSSTTCGGVAIWGRTTLRMGEAQRLEFKTRDRSVFVSGANRAWGKLTSSILLFYLMLMLWAPELPAQVDLYDNLHMLDGLPNVTWTSASSQDRRFAQQFLMGDHTTIDEVTVQLTKTGANVSGNMAFELWRDNGFDDPLLPNDPDAKIADIGLLDVTQMSRSRTNYTFDTSVTGLEPDGKYWIVANFEGLTGSLSTNDSIGWHHTVWPPPGGVPFSAEYIASRGADGTNGAASIHAIRQPYNGWVDLAQFQGFQTGFFAMSVTPLTGDFNADGELTIEDIDALTTEIIAGSNNPLFELTDDDAVDHADLDKWRLHAATHNGFSEAYLLGDSNLDGSVDALDLNNLALNWRQNVAEWSKGDFSADGVVNSTDLNSLALSWRQSIPTASAATAAVPEPSAWLLAVAGVAMIWRRRN